MDQEVIKREFDEKRKFLKEVLVKRIFDHGDLKIRLLEREFQLALFLTTISVTFLTIILPITLNSEFRISFFTILCFLLASFSGLARVISSTLFDAKELPKDEKIELDYWRDILNSAEQIYKEAEKGINDSEKLNNFNNLGQKVNDLVSKRTKEKVFFNKISLILHRLFLLFFTIGFLFFSYEILKYIWCIQ